MLKRYLTATLGLLLIALGVAISLKSNLGTSPISCPPCMMSLKWHDITVGQFTWVVNFSLIFVQMAVLKKRFRLSDLDTSATCASGPARDCRLMATRCNSPGVCSQ